MLFKRNLHVQKSNETTIHHLLDPPPISTFKVVTTVDFKRYRYRTCFTNALKVHRGLACSCIPKWVERSYLGLLSVIHNTILLWYQCLSHPLCAISQRYLPFLLALPEKHLVSVQSERIERFIEGPSILAVVWFASTPALSPFPVSKSSLFLSVPVCRRSSLLTGRGVGEGAGVEPNYKAWLSINRSILSWYGTLAFTIQWLISRQVP